MTQIAIKRIPTNAVPAGYHYELFPTALESDADAAALLEEGYCVILLDKKTAEEFLTGARVGKDFQIQLAFLTENALRINDGSSGIL